MITLTDPFGRTVYAPAATDDPREVLVRVLDQRATPMSCIGLDVETTGIDWSDSLRTVQFGCGELAVVLDAASPLHRYAAAEVLSRADVWFTAHNAAFDIGHLHRAGLIDYRELWSRTVDTIILLRLLHPGDAWSRPAHGLKAATEQWCGQGASSADAKDALKALWRENKWRKESDGWKNTPVDAEPYILYGAADVFDGSLLCATLLPLAAELIGGAVIAREHRVQMLCHGMTLRGLRVDVEAAAQDAEATAELVEVLRADIADQFGLENPNSGKQLTAWFAARGVELPDTKADTIKALDLDGEAAELRDMLLKLRATSKEGATYLRKLSSASTDSDGITRLHPSIGALNARTGRFSITGPSMQNFPPSLRKYVLAEPGHVLVDADFSAVEVRLAAALAGDEALAGVFRRGEDPYLVVAGAIWGVNESTPPDLRKMRRSASKPVLLGHIYGRGPNSLAKSLGIEKNEAKALQSKMNELFPTLPAYVARARHSTAAGLTATRLPSGRVVQVHPREQYTASVNSTVQGAGRDLLVDALLALDDLGYGERVWLPIHDEWIVQVPEEEAEKACADLSRVMTTELRGVPITADAEVIGSHWRKA
ncbi:DNA polymerase [Tsukamurella pseudospumae]|nr:DNA polymerase [Tsukamurella pseudospumae]